MHRHFGYTGRKLSRKAAPRKALLRNLASQVILHEQITTTLEKAKEVQPVVEKLITKAKKGSIADRRNASRLLSNKDMALEKLFVELGPLYKDRNGGYTRIVKVGNRKGDNASMALISLLDTEKLTKKEMTKPAPKAKANKPTVKATSKTAETKAKKEAPKSNTKKTTEKEK